MANQYYQSQTQIAIMSVNNSLIYEVKTLEHVY